MTDFIALLEIAGTILLIALPIIVISWALAGSDGPSLADVFAIPASAPLPRGVQEGEPVRYRVERLTRRGAEPVSRPHPAPKGRHAIEAVRCD